MNASSNNEDHLMNNTFARVVFAVAFVAVALVALGHRVTSSALAAAPSAVPAPAVDNALAAKPGEETAVFAGGCFWGIQAVYQHVKGVKSAVSGYAGGHVTSPSYEEVSSGATGHAESVRVVFDPSKVSYGQLLRVFFAVAHDPTQLNRQGPDVGTQYRSEIFTTNDSQKRIATAYIAQLTKAKAFSRPIVTKVEALNQFNVAEAYHQNYANIHPDDMYIRFNDAPKVDALKTELAPLYKVELSAWK
jgi:peptide-methionine (S)-S-oxide reductase